MIRFTTFAAFALPLFSAVPALAADEVSLKQDLQPIFNSKCVFCHVDGAESGELNLGRRKAYDALVNATSSQTEMPRVTPGKPAESYLIHKLKGSHLKAGGTGMRMPMNDPPAPIDPGQLDLIEQWVRIGAPRN